MISLFLGRIFGILDKLTLEYVFTVAVFLVWWIYIKNNKDKKKNSVIEREIQNISKNLGLIYKPMSAPRYTPLFESTELANLSPIDDTPDDIFDKNMVGPITYDKQVKDVRYFISGKVDGQFIEGFVQKAKLDLGMGMEFCEYFVSQTDVERGFSNIKFFITPKSRKKGITGLFHQIYQSPLMSQGEYKQMTTESPKFNKLYGVWIKRDNEYDEKIIYQVLTPDFIDIILSYEEPIYIEIIYDRLRIYRKIDELSGIGIEKILKMLLRMKNNITRHNSLAR